MAKKIEKLLELLDERLARGEVSEETYKELKAKYTAKLGKVSEKVVTAEPATPERAQLKQRVTIAWVGYFSTLGLISILFLLFITLGLPTIIFIGGLGILLTCLFLLSLWIEAQKPKPVKLLGAELEQKVFDYIQDRGGAIVKEECIADLDITENQLNATIRSLEKAGKLRLKKG